MLKILQHSNSFYFVACNQFLSTNKGNIHTYITVWVKIMDCSVCNPIVIAKIFFFKKTRIRYVISVKVNTEVLLTRPALQQGWLGGDPGQSLVNVQPSRKTEIYVTRVISICFHLQDPAPVESLLYLCPLSMFLLWVE